MTEQIPTPFQRRGVRRCCEQRQTASTTLTLQGTLLSRVSDYNTRHCSTTALISEHSKQAKNQPNKQKTPTTNQHFQEPHQRAGSRDKKPPLFLLFKAQVTQTSHLWITSHLCNWNSIEVAVIRTQSSSNRSRADSKLGHTSQLQKQDWLKFYTRNKSSVQINTRSSANPALNPQASKVWASNRWVQNISKCLDLVLSMLRRCDTAAGELSPRSLLREWRERR